MLALSKVKKDIEFNKTFTSLLEILKSIAVSQFHLLEKKLKIYGEFEQTLRDFFRSFDMKDLRHPFLEPGDRPQGIVAVTSDQGLLGGLNMRVVSTAIGAIKTDRDELVVIGERGKIYARDKKVAFTAFPGIRDEWMESQAKELRNYLFQKAVEGKLGSLTVVYPRALSLVNQRVELTSLLPYAREETASEGVVNFSESILESKPEQLLEYLVFLLIGHKLNAAFGQSRLAELGARYMHLEESSQKIQELNKKLKLKYFRLRHESIDASMRELFIGRTVHGN